MAQPGLRVEPNDQYRCLGCGQELLFDRRGYVAEASLRSCQSACNWLLLRRNGLSVNEDPGPNA
jgi:hypothetical protein